jgi:putative queuosine salvage protein
VRASAEFVMSQARFVSIDERALREIGATFDDRMHVPEWNHAYHFGDGTARTANYILLLDALNFSFWGEPRWSITYHGERLDGYWALAASLKRALEDGDDLADARVMAQMDEAHLAHILRGDGTLPLLSARATNAREVGRVLTEKFGGQFAHLIEAANFDATAVVRSVIENFSSFRDEAEYRGQRVKFYKRAQIVAADVYGAFGGQHWGALKNLNTLTCFADYKLPQILRRWGVLRYASAFAEKVDHRVEIPAGSDEEIEIRAATIVAVERMCALLNARGVKLNSVQIDWALWEAAQGAPLDGKPYHRTRTIYY